MLVSKAIGIDLGTTNSAVAVMDISDSEVILYRDKNGRPTIPSCVWFDSRKNEYVVGYRALNRRGSHPEPITSIKRRMGTQTTAILGKEEKRPEEISAYIIAELQKCIQESLVEHATGNIEYIVDRGLITVPAYFDLPQMEATRVAGRIAELEVIELLHEPVAAAVYYAWKYDIGDGIFMVYDLGGGTFDVSILRRTAGEFEVLGISGDNFLGGDDLDKLLAHWICERLIEDDYELELDTRNDPDDAIRFVRLVSLAEQVKKALSDRDTYRLLDQGSLVDKGGSRVVIEMLITRDQFQSLVRDHIIRTIPRCWEALAKAHERAGIYPHQVSRLFLVGGSSYIPLVQDAVKMNFCRLENVPDMSREEIEIIVNDVEKDYREIIQRFLEAGESLSCEEPTFDEPDTCVASGAAIRAASCGLDIRDDRHRVKMSFRGQGTADSDIYSLYGSVESLTDDVDLTEGKIMVRLEEGDFSQIRSLDEKGQFGFSNIPLQSGVINDLSIIVYDRNENPVAELGRPVAQSDQHRDIGGVLSTAVLSKPILLEGLVQDRVVRAFLLPEGTSLPAEANFQFELTDSSGQVRFPLYQGSRIIKEVSVDVDRSLPVGTAIQFTISCSEQVNIEISGSIAGRQFDVAVGPPPPPAPPTRQEILALIDKFNRKIQELDPAEGVPFVVTFRGLLSDVEQAMYAADDAKTISKVADIEGLIKSIDLRAPKLDPPWETFQQMIGAARSAARFAADLIQDFDSGSTTQTIEQILRDARTAYQSSDQQHYTEIIQDLHSFTQSLQKQMAEATGIKRGEVPPEVVAAAELQSLEAKVSSLEFLSIIQGRPDIAERLSELTIGTDDMHVKVNEAPNEVLRWCSVMDSELRKLLRELKPEATAEDVRSLVGFGADQQTTQRKLSRDDIFKI